MGSTTVAICTLEKTPQSTKQMPQKLQANTKSLEDSWRLTGLQSLFEGWGNRSEGWWLEQLYQQQKQQLLLPPQGKMHLPTWSEDKQASNIAYSPDFFIYLSYLLGGIAYSNVFSSHLIFLKMLS